jgi:predicted metalloprotease with PDZ domain
VTVLCVGSRRQPFAAPLPSARKTLLSAAFCLLFLLTCGVPARATIQYEVLLDHPERHIFHVTMTVPDVTGQLTIRMAAWNALYQIRDFSSHVQQVEAFAGSQKVAAEKIDKQTWRIQGTGTIKITYASYWDESGPFASQLNAEHAFINPAMILFYVPSRRSESVSLNVVFSSPSWRPAGALLADHAEYGQNQSAIFNAASFEALADAPIEVGKIELFEVPGVSSRISVVVHGTNWHKKQVEDDLRRICKYELKLMDGAPFEHYTFLLHFGRGAGGGGMEHMNSTAIGAFSDEYLSGLAAHEFFHLWNVKRIRPASLDPVDDTKEQYTRALWFAEGVTNTYGSYALVRSGIWSKEQFYGDLSEQITEVEGRPANRWQSAEQSSLDAWFEKYPLYNQPEYSVSYYTKGQILGDLLDILIRDRTENQRSLDDVMRLMNTNFAKQNRAYRDSLDVQLSAETVAGSSFEAFFKKYVAGTEPIPYQQILALAGLTLRFAEHRKPVLGFSVQHDSSGPYVVNSVDPDSPASQAGLKAEDIILSWSGGEVPRRLEHWLEQQKIGDVLRLQVRRDGADISVEFRLGEIRETFYQVVEESHASEKARHIREGVLRGETAAVMAHR